jgi:hypothetical protein
VSISPVRVAGAFLLLLAVGLGLLVAAHGSWLSSLFAVMTVIAAVVAVVRSRQKASLYAGVVIVCFVTMIAVRPPTNLTGLLSLAPLGVLAVVGLLLITSQSSIVESLNLAEWSILLGAGVVSVLVAIVALVTPLAEVPGQLVSGGFLIAELGILYQLARKSRYVGGQ